MEWIDRGRRRLGGKRKKKIRSRGKESHAVIDVMRSWPRLRVI